MAVALVIAVVAAAFGVYGLSRVPPTRTSIVYRTTTFYENVMMAGTCEATSYLFPDTESVSPVNVTVTSGTRTSYYTSVSYSYPGKTTLGSTSYSTSTYTNGTGGFATTTTSPLNPIDLPSGEWTVVACTYSPP